MKPIWKVAIGVLVVVAVIVLSAILWPLPPLVSAREAYSLALPHAQDTLPDPQLTEVQMHGRRDAQGNAAEWEFTFCTPDKKLEITIKGNELEDVRESESSTECIGMHQGWIDSTVAWHDIDCEDATFGAALLDDKWIFEWCCWDNSLKIGDKVHGALTKFRIDAFDGRLLETEHGDCVKWWEYE